MAKKKTERMLQVPAPLAEMERAGEVHNEGHPENERILWNQTTSNTKRSWTGGQYTYSGGWYENTAALYEYGQAGKIFGKTGQGGKSIRILGICFKNIQGLHRGMSDAGAGSER